MYAKSSILNIFNYSCIHPFDVSNRIKEDKLRETVHTSSFSAVYVSNNENELLSKFGKYFQENIIKFKFTLIFNSREFSVPTSEKLEKG